MAIQVVKPSRAEMQKCIARFDDIKGISEGIPDMKIEEYHRTFYSVIGFDQPKGDEQYSPFGNAVRPLINHMKPGFGVAFVKATPGHGAPMHTHDTNETFMVVEGKWRLEWQGAEGDEHAILGPKDFICFPIGVQRRFICEEPAPGKTEGVLLGIITGDEPAAEYAPEVRTQLVDAGILQPT
jgi:mannose-6-phosphate isomerase-like protein (cupin superfamily)